MRLIEMNQLIIGGKMNIKQTESTYKEITILMPCLNEAETLATCINKANEFLRTNDLNGEVLIADNGSTDGSQQIAENHGARVVSIKEKGYGSAISGGVKAALGKYIIVGDADDSYDFLMLMPYLLKLREGYDLVMGNRFKGGIKPNAMPPLHRYLGNPVLSGIGRLFFGNPAGDFHCGLRGFSKESMLELNLQTTGMEYASEMIVKASLHNLRITEVPTTLSPDGRSRPPHLRSWRDGWRHLRFLLIYSPRWLFLYPGMGLSLLGLIVILALTTGPKVINGTTFDIHTLLYGSMSLILGIQIIYFAVFAKIFASKIGMHPDDDRITNSLRVFSLERGIIFGCLLTIAGITGSIVAFIVWGSKSFGPIVPSSMMRITIPSLTATVVGMQVIFGSFLLGLLGIKVK